MTGRGRGRRRAGEDGQAAAELALVLPLVGLMLLTVVQLALVARDQVLVVHAAREGAREAAVDPRPGAARTSAQRGSGLKPDHLTVEASGREDGPQTVVVVVRYRAPTDVPIIGRLLPDVVLGAKAAMRKEF